PLCLTVILISQRNAENESSPQHPVLAAVHDLVVLLKGPRGHGTQSRRPSIVHSISTPGGHCHEQGKTWLACALGHQACRAGWTVLYLRLPRLLQELPIAKGDGRYPTLMASLAQTALLILDDWGLATLNDENRRDILELLEDRHGRGA